MTYCHSRTAGGRKSSNLGNALHCRARTTFGDLGNIELQLFNKPTCNSPHHKTLQSSSNCSLQRRRGENKCSCQVPTCDVFPQLESPALRFLGLLVLNRSIANFSPSKDMAVQGSQINQQLSLAVCCKSRSEILQYMSKWKSWVKSYVEVNLSRLVDSFDPTICMGEIMLATTAKTSCCGRKIPSPASQILQDQINNLRVRSVLDKLITLRQVFDFSK
jgi:hypothetical protein